MIEGLMHICPSWGEQDCHPQVREEKLPRETGPGQPCHIWPCGDEQRRLDEICMTCEHRVFEIETRECPICEKESVQPASPKSISYGPARPSCTTYSYECTICGTKLISQKDLFR